MMMSPTGDNRSRSGVTFVEAMLAVILLFAGMTGVLRAFSVLMTAGAVERNTVGAMSLLNRKTAELEQAAIERDGLPAWAGRRVNSGIVHGSRLWTLEITAYNMTRWDEFVLTVFDEQSTPVRRFSRVVYVPKHE